jgi:uncharacterized protein YndB with AHSA1/START domain
MTAPVDTNETTVRKSVTVNTPIERAFEVFTTGFDSWWPRSHRVGEADLAEFVLEPRAGGRWYERGVDGNECATGIVLEFAPPKHLALSWHLNGEYRRDPDPEHASRVDVWFTAESSTSTRVELAHSQLERHGDSWKQLRDGISSEGGWQQLLDLFAIVAASR